MRMGYDMRIQAIAAVQAKVLRLNAVAVSDVTTGKVGVRVSQLNSTLGTPTHRLPLSLYDWSS